MVLPCFVCVDTGFVGVVQMFGKYSNTREPGCSCIPFPFATCQTVSMALNQLECKSECKTKDNVTMQVITAVQYRILKDQVETAVFDIVHPQAMMRAEVDSILRSTLPSMDLDDAYSSKEKLMDDIMTSVKVAMQDFGYDIVKVLITDLVPERSVLTAMNEINAARRQRDAAIERGEADKVLKVKQSEGDAEAKRLQGVGLAQMRSAIAQGFKDSMETMQESGMSSQESMHMMVMTQYLDTLKEFSNGKASIMVPHGGSGAKDMQAQIRDGSVASQKM